MLTAESRELARRALRLLGFLLLAFVAATVGGRAGQASDSDRAERLRELGARVAESRRLLEGARQRVAGLTGQLRETRLELDLLAAEVEEARLRLLQAQVDLTASEERRAELARQVARLRGKVRRRLVALARYGGGGYLRLLLSMELESTEDPRPAARLLRYLVRQDGQALNLYRQAENDLEAETQRLESRRQAALALLAEESEREAALDVVRRRQQRLLDRALARETSAAQEARDVELRLERLESLMALIAAQPSDPLRGRAIEDFRGAVDWPLDGTVQLPFGPRRDPRYGTKVPHNGIRIACESSATRAVFPGKVRYAAAFEGFGQTVILQHRERVFTLYAGLEEILVETDDVLPLGANLGSCGETLYLEFRAGSKAEDPLSWLR
ncbi:MAG: peptidoglycan DD-metalloendopeptidase family protein [Acidobacteriota bacterium]